MKVSNRNAPFGPMTDFKSLSYIALLKSHNVGLLSFVTTSSCIPYRQMDTLNWDTFLLFGMRRGQSYLQIPYSGAAFITRNFITASKILTFDHYNYLQTIVTCNSFRFALGSIGEKHNIRH